MRVKIGLIMKNKVIIKLLNYSKQSINHIFYHAHFVKAVKSLPETTPCFTDGSILRNRVSFAYSIGDKTSSCRHRKNASILTAELQAIFQRLEEIPFPSHILNPFLSARTSLLTHSHHQHIFSTPTQSYDHLDF